ncbi:MAG: hypothetical protein NT141_04435 [candidate division WWE3 bacterium]|nr:hypothetical protein [candidate division WWE3 bacterium]
MNIKADLPSKPDSESVATTVEGRQFEPLSTEYSNVFFYEELAKLPEGIAFPLSPEVGQRGRDYVCDKIYNIIHNSHNKDYFPDSWSQYGNDSYLIGRIMPYCYSTERSPGNMVLSELLEECPNLCWLRGGNLERSDGFATIEGVFGRNGYVGDLESFRYAFEDHNGHKRDVTVLYVASLAGVIDGVRSGALSLGSESLHDVVISSRDLDKYNEWCKEHLKVFMLGDSETEKQQILQLLNSRAIKT